MFLKYLNYKRYCSTCLPLVPDGPCYSQSTTALTRLLSGPLLLAVHAAVMSRAAWEGSGKSNEGPKWQVCFDAFVHVFKKGLAINVAYIVYLWNIRSIYEPFFNSAHAIQRLFDVLTTIKRHHGGRLRVQGISYVFYEPNLGHGQICSLDKQLLHNQCSWYIQLHISSFL